MKLEHPMFWATVSHECDVISISHLRFSRITNDILCKCCVCVLFTAGIDAAQNDRRKFIIGLRSEQKKQSWQEIPLLRFNLPFRVSKDLFFHNYFPKHFPVVFYNPMFKSVIDVFRHKN